MKLNPDRAALVVTDPQIDFLSPEGVTWGVVGESVQHHNTVENLGRLFAFAKNRGITVAISPHYYYPTDKGWRFEGALEKYLALEEQIGMPPLGSTVSYFLLGQKDEYEKNMAYLKETLGEIHPYIAIVYVESDQLDLAFEMIDKLPQIDQSVLGYLPYLRKLRQHPRWQAVAERAGLWPDPRDEIKFEINVPDIYDQSKL